MKDDLDIKNLNDDEDTLYFTDVDKSTYEKEFVYKESDMFENYKPLTNTNSVEYDEGDYASEYFGEEREEEEEKKNLIFGYIFAILVIVLLGIILIMCL